MLAHVFMLKLISIMAITLTVSFVPTIRTQALNPPVQVAKKTIPATPKNRDATALLENLKEMHSMVKVGFTARDYVVEARRLQVKLDRFLASKGAQDYPGGYFLKMAAETYIESIKYFPGLQSNRGNFGNINEVLLQNNWNIVDSLFPSLETCHSFNFDFCKTIRQGFASPKELTHDYGDPRL